MIPQNLKDLLEHQHYKLVGRHSAVKLCHWTKKSILNQGVCYKQEFYGVQSHRCLQMTPAVGWCTQRCVFCWRNTEYTLGSTLEECDDPERIIDEAVLSQRKLLSGFGGIPDRIDKRKYLEAQSPNQAAISLVGEPTIYPKLGALIGEFRRRGFTTFLVTNGTMPKALEELDILPTQLYLSLDAPTEEIYNRICHPVSGDCWEKIDESLSLFPSLKTKKAVRLTLVRNLNMLKPQEYAKLILKATPDYIEAKAYMFIGGSRKRLNLDNMPSFAEVREFSEKLSECSGYGIKNQKEDSRVVLLSRD